MINVCYCYVSCANSECEGNFYLDSRKQLVFLDYIHYILVSSPNVAWQR